MGALTASVVVPATTANLGCAFDCAGIALNLYLRAQATLTDSPGLTVSYQGADAEGIPRDESNLVVQAIRHAEAWAQKHLPAAQFEKVLTGIRPGAAPGLKIEIQNEIPLGVGLGSSAAAIIAGILLWRELCAAQLDDAALLRMALEIEGHPDNLAAAIHGGFVVSATSGGSALVLVARTPVSPELDFVAVIPDVPLATSKSRAALPATYARQDVVANLQRTALLTACFFSGKRLTPELFHDRLHQPYRSPLVPGIAECLEYRHDGLLGIFLSGAGSAVMAIVERSPAGETTIANYAKIIGDALVAKFGSKGTAARALPLKADNLGAQVTGPMGPRSFRAPAPL